MSHTILHKQVIWDLQIIKEAWKSWTMISMRLKENRPGGLLPAAGPVIVITLNHGPREGINSYLPTSQHHSLTHCNECRREKEKRTEVQRGKYS